MIRRSLILLILAGCLTACIGTAGCSRIGYSNEVACTDIGTEIRKTIENGRELGSFSEAQLREELEIDGEYDDYYSAYSTDVNDLDEVHVLHARTSSEAKELADECREYIDEKREDTRAFVSSYAPDQVPKLDSAEVRRFGNYVVCVILDRETADAVFEGVKEKLKVEG